MIKFKPAHGKVARCLALSPDGKLLASGGDDGRVVLWSLPTLKRTKTLKVGGKVKCLAFSHDGSRLYGGGGDDLRPFEVSLKDFAWRRLVVGASSSILFVSPLAKGRRLVTVTASKRILIHRLPGKRPSGKGTEVKLTLLEKRRVAGDSIRNVKLSKDRRFLAISSFPGHFIRKLKGTLAIFDLEGKAGAAFTLGAGDAQGSSFTFCGDARKLFLHVPKKPVQVIEFIPTKRSWARSALGVPDVRIPVEASASCVGDKEGRLFLAVRFTVDQIDVREKPVYPFSEAIIASPGPPPHYPEREFNDMLWIPGPPRLVCAYHDGTLAVISRIPRFIHLRRPWACSRPAK